MTRAVPALVPALIATLGGFAAVGGASDRAPLHPAPRAGVKRPLEGTQSGVRLVGMKSGSRPSPSVSSAWCGLQRETAGELRDA